MRYNKYEDWLPETLLSEMQECRRFYDKYRLMEEVLKKKVKEQDKDCITCYGEAVLIHREAINDKNKQIDFLLDKLSDDDRADYAEKLNDGVFMGEPIVAVRIKIASDMFNSIE